MKTTHDALPRILEFSGHEGKRTSRMVWLLGGLLSLFAIGLSGQRRKERALASRHASKPETDLGSPYGGGDVAFGIIAVVIIAAVIAMFVLMIFMVTSALPLIIDEVVRRNATGFQPLP